VVSAPFDAAAKALFDDTIEGRFHDEKDRPTWADVDEDERIAWRATAQKVVAAAMPDIGIDPMKGTRSDRVAQSLDVCREAYVRQQQCVPDQTALVWRWHLGALIEAATRLQAVQHRNAMSRSAELRELIDMLTAATVEEGVTVFEHSAEEIGLAVMNCRAEILALEWIEAAP
jgi:hypothetical protein